MDPMFRSLFNHINSRDIAMTAPVDVTYADDPQRPEALTAMAFLYRTPTQGVAETNGSVVVKDQPAQTYASLGLRGNYTGSHITDAIATLDAWLAKNDDTWQPVGPPRYLGYNGPFTPAFLRYGEVQRPVQPATSKN